MTLSIQLIALQTIVRKETIRILRIWIHTLLSPLIIQILYFVILGKIVGAFIQPIHGIQYMSFIIPGIVMMAVIRGAYDNVVSSFYNDKWQCNIEEILVSPTNEWTIVLGYVLGGVIRGIGIGIFVFLASLFFGRTVMENGWVILFFSLGNVTMISLAGLLNGVLASSVDDEEFFRNFVLKPLIYLGGVFYSIHDLPALWQWASFLNPILFMINGFRYGFFGFSDVDPGICAIVVTGGIVALVIVNLWFLKQGRCIRD